MKDLKKFIKLLRKINHEFEVGQKFNYQVEAYISIYLRDGEKEVNIFGNVFGMDLKENKIKVPDIIIYERKKGEIIARLPTKEEKEFYSNLKNIIKKMEV